MKPPIGDNSQIIYQSYENATFIFYPTFDEITRGEDDLNLTMKFSYENDTLIPDSSIYYNITNTLDEKIFEETVWTNTTAEFNRTIPWQTFNGQDEGNYTIAAVANSTTTTSYNITTYFTLIVLEFGQVRMFFPLNPAFLIRNQDNQVTCIITNVGGTTVTNVSVTNEITKTGTIGSITRSYSINNLEIAEGAVHNDTIGFFPDTYLYQKHSFTIIYRTIDDPETQRVYLSDPIEIIVMPDIVVESFLLPTNVTMGEKYIITTEIINNEEESLIIVPNVLCDQINFDDADGTAILIPEGSNIVSISGNPLVDGVYSLNFGLELEWTTVSETKWYSILLLTQYQIIDIIPLENPPMILQPKIFFAFVFSSLFVGLVYFSRDIILGIARRTRTTSSRIFPEVSYLLETVILDGSNIAWEEKNNSNKPQINNIESMINRLSRANFKKIITVADAALRYQIDEQKRLDRLVREGAMKMLPARVDGDKFILRIAEEENAMIVSNDMFKEFRESTPWIDERRIPYTILDGEVYLHPTSVLPSVEIVSREDKERKENDNTFEN
ncbi:MAG: hypothetical protein H7644_00550 [Candidatus Heimdallarchaeota archaeon]|nr:hypothetical protein [Candidatus Heimdallarchaeota archaeon]MCK5142238.1 hypothetical protein [Candidatus Heimdallarchaeota archaeon]